jgi:hypothetical protein
MRLARCTTSARHSAPSLAKTRKHLNRVLDARARNGNFDLDDQMDCRDVSKTLLGYLSAITSVNSPHSNASADRPAAQRPNKPVLKNVVHQRAVDGSLKQHSAHKEGRFCATGDPAIPVGLRILAGSGESPIESFRQTPALYTATRQRQSLLHESGALPRIRSGTCNGHAWPGKGRRLIGMRPARRHYEHSKQEILEHNSR